MRAIALLFLGLMMTGCFQTTQIQTVAPEVRLVIEPDQRGEALLYEAFATSPIPWDKSDLDNVTEARATLKSVGTYLKERRDREGSVTYATLKEQFYLMQYSYAKYQDGLDNYAANDGVLTAEQWYIYNDVCKDVRSNLESMRVYLESIDKDSASKASPLSLDNMKAVYNTLKPLLGMVL